MFTLNRTCILTNGDLKAEVPAAVQWLLIAGSDLYELIDSPQIGNSIPPSDLYPEESSGLSQRRWALWKTRLLWVREQAELDVETKELANRAYTRMIEIETA
jgi:hypothetical protein